MKKNDLVEIRQKIDHIDQLILSNLSKRKKLVRLVGEYKMIHSIKPLDKARWEQVLVSRSRWGESIGLDSKFVVDIFELIHHYSLQIEENYVKSKNS